MLYALGSDHDRHELMLMLPAALRNSGHTVQHAVTLPT